MNRHFICMTIFHRHLGYHRAAVLPPPTVYIFCISKIMSPIFKLTFFRRAVSTIQRDEELSSCGPAIFVTNCHQPSLITNITFSNLVTTQLGLLSPPPPHCGRTPYFCFVRMIVGEYAKRAVHRRYCSWQWS